MSPNLSKMVYLQYEHFFPQNQWVQFMAFLHITGHQPFDQNSIAFDQCLHLLLHCSLRASIFLLSISICFYPLSILKFDLRKDLLKSYRKRIVYLDLWKIQMVVDTIQLTMYLFYDFFQ